MNAPTPSSSDPVAEACQGIASTLFEPLPYGVAAADARGVVLYSNPTLSEQFGIRPGVYLADHPSDLGSFADRALADGTHRIGTLSQEHGPDHIVFMHLIRTQEGIEGGLLFVVSEEGLIDLTRKIPVVDNLFRERDAIIDFSVAGLWVCDETGAVLHLNPEAARLSDVKPEEVLGRNLADLVKEGYMDKSVTLEVIKRQKPVNMLIKTRLGIKVMSTGNPVFDDEGRLIRVVVTERDMSELEALHEKLEEEEALRQRFQTHMIEMQETSSLSKKLLARSSSMQKLLHQAVKISKVDSTVLILGDSGTGKELIAELIHKNSVRADRPLIKINCGAIPEALVESELFGYERGAFTGAQAKGKPGYLEMADRGMLFLDEIGELPLPSQVKLLRVVEDGHLDRLGSTVTRSVDVRILAATNRDLDEMVRRGTFREDLYYRLNVLPLRIPPLRERKECIPVLLRHYLDHFAAKHGTKKQLSPAALDALVSYSYPGNVRELINICERLVILLDRDYVLADDLPMEVIRETKTELPIWREGKNLKDIMEIAERNALTKAREEFRTQYKMARALGVDQSTVARKMKKYGLI